MAKTTLGDVAQYINGRAFKPTEWEDTGLPIIRIQNLTNTKQDCNRTTQEYESKYLVNDGDLLFAWSASLGAHIWHGGSGWLNQHIFKVVPNKGTDKLYLYYYLLHIVDVLYGKTHGSGMVHITLKPFKNTEIYLPSLSEQQHIVDRIESLFAKLDEAKEKAQAALESFETRKAAILHKAFTGELTAKWREENGVGIESWTLKTSKELFTYVTSGSRGWAQYYSDFGDIFIRMGNLDHGTIELDLSDIQHISLPCKVEGQRSKLQKGDILISITADVGMIALIRNVEFNAYINQHIALARPTGIDNSEFIAWYLVSDVGLKQMQRRQRGATKVGLGLDDIRMLELNMPTLLEQKEIVRLLDSFFAKEQKAKELCSVLDKIDLIKKSILARAFRGELGTNDPTEESAMELLKSLV